MTIELKPCPFCGEQPKMQLFRNGFTPPDDSWRVECRCGAVVGGPDEDKEYAAERWNPRTPQPVSIRPLEWRAYGNQHMSGWQGMGVMGALYYITDTRPDGERNGGWWYGDNWFDTGDEAKSAAQQDYEQRIRSAILDPVSKLSGDSGKQSD